MPVFRPNYYVQDSSRFVYEYYGDANKIFLDYDYTFKNLADVHIVNYKQTDSLVHKRKMPKLIKQIKRYPQGDTFDGHGWSPILVFEYIFKGDYHQIITPIPEVLYKLPPRMFTK